MPPSARSFNITVPCSDPGRGLESKSLRSNGKRRGSFVFGVGLEESGVKTQPMATSQGRSHVRCRVMGPDFTEQQMVEFLSVFLEAAEYFRRLCKLHKSTLAIPISVVAPPGLDRDIDVRAYLRLAIRTPLLGLTKSNFRDEGGDHGPRSGVGRRHWECAHFCGTPPIAVHTAPVRLNPPESTTTSTRLSWSKVRITGKMADMIPGSIGRRSIVGNSSSSKARLQWCPSSHSPNEGAPGRSDCRSKPPRNE